MVSVSVKMKEYPIFEVRQKVRFQHCDPAGIVFYPRYYEMLNAAIEDYFADVLGMTSAQMCNNRKGIPMVHISLDFRKPSYLGNILSINLTPIHVGRTSLRLRVLICDEHGEERVTGDAVLVYTDLATNTPVPIHDIVTNAFGKK